MTKTEDVLLELEKSVDDVYNKILQVAFNYAIHVDSDKEEAKIPYTWVAKDLRELTEEANNMFKPLHELKEKLSPEVVAKAKEESLRLLQEVRDMDVVMESVSMDSLTVGCAVSTIWDDEWYIVQDIDIEHNKLTLLPENSKEPVVADIKEITSIICYDSDEA